MTRSRSVALIARVPLPGVRCKRMHAMVDRREREREKRRSRDRSGMTSHPRNTFGPSIFEPRDLTFRRRRGSSEACVGSTQSAYELSSSLFALLSLRASSIRIIHTYTYTHTQTDSPRASRQRAYAIQNCRTNPLGLLALAEN